MSRRRQSLRPNPERFAHLPPHENPYAPANKNPLSKEGRSKNLRPLPKDDKEIQRILAKTPADLTAREMGILGGIRGGKAGGMVTRALIEKGKQALHEEEMLDIDQRIARGEDEPD